MKSSKQLLLLITLPIATIVTLLAGNIAPDKIPGKALSALKAQAGKAKIAAYETETKQGEACFEAEWMEGKLEHSAVVTSEGLLVQSESRLAANSIPAGVLKAAKQHGLSSNAIMAETVTLTFYEVEGMVDGKTKEILLSSNGKIVQIRVGDDDDN